MNINEVLIEGRNELLQNDVDPREARLLLAFVLQLRKEELITIHEISEDNYKKYKEIIKQRASGEPYVYLTGSKEFMKLDFKVNKNVLIPREDTELLVEQVIEIIKNRQNSENKSNKISKSVAKLSILDMCTGSGCIAISLAKLLENVQVTAIDISEKALEIAKENAKNNNVKVDFVLSNLFQKVDKKFDIIVSNPPYIQTKVIEELQKEVKNEPILALDGGETGLDFYEEIIEKAPKFLNENGVLAFEIGYDQANDVASKMIENGFENIIVKKDLGNQDRVVIGTLKNK